MGWADALKTMFSAALSGNSPSQQQLLNLSSGQYAGTNAGAGWRGMGADPLLQQGAGDLATYEGVRGAPGFTPVPETQRPIMMPTLPRQLEESSVSLPTSMQYGGAAPIGSIGRIMDPITGATAGFTMSNSEGRTYPARPIRPMTEDAHRQVNDLYNDPAFLKAPRNQQINMLGTLMSKINAGWSQIPSSVQQSTLREWTKPSFIGPR